MKERFRKINSDFYIQLCDSELLIKKCMKIRYRVYCEEKNFEQLNNKKIETDQFDSKSFHFIVTDRETEKDIATFRIVYSDILPVDFYMKKFNKNKAGKSVEASRFTIIKEYRGEKSGELLIGMMHSIIYKAFLMDCEYIYMEVEKRLAKFVNGCNIPLSRATPYFKHNGQRAVHFLNMKEVLKSNFKDKSKKEILSEYNELIKLNK